MTGAIDGCLIDERTTVFTMGRTALVFLGEDSDAAATFRGPPACLAVARSACRTHPAERHATVAAFYTAWREAWEGLPIRLG